MAAGIESTAVFRARALQVGVSVDILDLFAVSGVSTMGSFAFCSAFQPGNPDETAFVAVVERMLTRPALVGEMANIRRLYYESHTVLLAEMKGRVERTEDSKPTKLMPAERASRHAQQQARISGLVLSGPYECSHSLVDKIFQMLDDNVLRYLPLDELTTREQELMGERKDSDITRSIQENKEGLLKAVWSQAAVTAELGNDLKIKEALCRRGLAFDQANLIGYAVHQEWIEVLFRRLSESPPPNYRSLSMDQIIAADKKLFVRMAEDTRGGIAPSIAGGRPLDAALAKWMSHQDVLYLLSPLQSGGARKGKGKSSKMSDAIASDHPYGGNGKQRGKGGGKQGKKGRGKGGGKSGGKSFDVPPGCVASTPAGRRICFSFNRPGGCPSGILAGSDCPRGAHICGKMGCFQDHPAYDCTLRSS